jgi:DNA (cytosine-5)-methyltransferase 1
MTELTHASFFSGVGGLDLGLERAGWRTLSHSEIDAYASAVLASRWPGTPNLGSIIDVAGSPHAGAAEWRGATLFSGGFPCQDLSIAGKRRGLAGARSGLAFAFLDLVERYRPPALLLENVPGLLSSHRGRDLGALLHRLGELGYWWAYRVLNAQHFGVPQRRRRVFIVALHARTGAGAAGASAVFDIGTRCGRHPATSGTAGTDTTGGAGIRPGDASGIAGALTHRYGKGINSTLDDGAIVVGTLNTGGAGGGFRSEPGAHLVVGALVPGAKGWRGMRGDGSDPIVMAPSFSKRAAQQLPTRDDGLSYSLTTGEPPRVFGKVHRAVCADDAETWRDADIASSLTVMDGDRTTLVGGVRRLTPVECERIMGWPDGWTIPGEWRGKRYDGTELLPPGLDSNRYRCCGNGVVAPVAEWIGQRLAAII